MKILTCLRFDSLSVALAACVAADSVQTVSDDVQSDAQTRAVYLSELYEQSCVEGRTRSSASNYGRISNRL